MSNKNNPKAELRTMLLRSGNVKVGDSAQTYSIKPVDAAASRALAIASRRNEMASKPTVNFK